MEVILRLRESSVLSRYCDFCPNHPLQPFPLVVFCVVFFSNKLNSTVTIHWIHAEHGYSIIKLLFLSEEPRLATTPFIRPPLASAHLSKTFHPDVKISESFYYFEDLFNATTSVLRPGFYGPTLVASTGFHCIF